MSISVSARLRAAAFLTAMLLTTPAEANRFRDNPDRIVDRAKETWTSPIGELETTRVTYDSNGNAGVDRGTGFLVSPCYVLTARHVVYGADLSPLEGRDYSMVFRAGVGANAPFQGHTIARPIVSGDENIAGRNDWALLKLQVCLGGRSEFGWLTSRQIWSPKTSPAHKPVTVLGYPGSGSRGELHLGSGQTMGPDDYRNGSVLFSASIAPGQSGGPVFVLADSYLSVVGLATYEGGRVRSGEYATYSAPVANHFEPAEPILHSPIVSSILKADIADFGKPNPAAERLRMDHLPQ